MFWWLSSKVLSYKTDFINSSFPTFPFSFSRTNHFKHLSFCHRFYFINRYIPFSSLLFTLLLHHIGEYFWVSLLLSIHQICGDSTFFYRLCFAFCILFFMLFNSFFHLNFLFKAFFVKDLSFNASKCLCFFRYDFGFSSLFLSPLLLSIQPLTIPFLM